MEDASKVQGHSWCRCCGKGSLYALGGLLLAALTVMVALQARNLNKEFAFIGVPVESHTVTFNGEGRAIGVPDVAKTRLGMTVERPTVLEAQDENTATINKLVEELTTLGVERKDIQTSDYSVYPVYDYGDGRQTLRGYQVSQGVQVTIRQLDTVGSVLALVGRLGLNQVGGIEFTVDDPEDLRTEARNEAIAEAKRKAQELADAVGVRLGRVVDVQESLSGSPFTPGYYDKAAEGYGGGSVPTVEPGSAEVVMSASITYEIIN